MKVVCLGGGAAGLYFAISMKRRDPSHEVVVIERNRSDDAFTFIFEQIGRASCRERVSYIV